MVNTTQMVSVLCVDFTKKVWGKKQICVEIATYIGEN